MSAFHLTRTAPTEAGHWHRHASVQADDCVIISVAPAQSDELVNGQVTKVDRLAGKVTIKHGPLRKFDMDEGMTMVFHAADPAMLQT
jgi:Cu/Ag efflux protein CusF